MDINYRQLVDSRDARTQKVACTPLGNVYKKQIDKKYTNVLKIREDILENIVLRGDVEYECNINPTLDIPGQIHFSAIKDEGEVLGLKTDNGNFLSLKNLLSENPAIVAQNHFVDDIVDGVLNITAELHKRNIFHVCYDLSNVMVNRSSHEVQLLSHGSYYINIKNRDLVYGGFKDSVAPEVLDENGTVDERSDIYSIGKFIDQLLSQSSVPQKYKQAIEKATKEDPDKRYQNVEEMRHDLKVKGRVFNVLYAVVALIIAALFVLMLGSDFFFQEKQEVEFVKPAAKSATDELIEDGYDPITDLGIIPSDSASKMTPEQKKAMEEEEKANEEKFRKAYAAKAAQIIGKMYNKEKMSGSESDFLSGNQKTMEELSRLQTELGSKSNLNQSKSQKIAAEVIDGLAKQQMDKMKSE